MNKWLHRLRMEIWSSEPVPATRVADGLWAAWALPIIKIVRSACLTKVGFQEIIRRY